MIHGGLGVRANGGPGVGPVILVPLNEPGLYGGQVTFPRFGSWTVTVDVADALGSGEASLTEEDPSGSAGRRGQVRSDLLHAAERGPVPPVRRPGRRQYRGAGGALAGRGGLVWAHSRHPGGLLCGPGQPSPRAAAGVVRLFPWVAGLSLAALAASGLCNAIYNAPIRPPGIFNLAVMERIPFGMAYLASLAVKVIALTTGAGLALAIARALRKSTAPLPPQGASADALAATPAVSAAMTQAAVSLKRLALTNAAFGVASAVAVSVAIYLHLLSHLALAVPR
ncbi:MAG: hypothetical protein HY688_00845 [Chloroflexi bacterium]|nr:hypothetical protein [Chloroflexota bacterium]